MNRITQSMMMAALMITTPAAAAPVTLTCTHRDVPELTLSFLMDIERKLVLTGTTSLGNHSHSFTNSSILLDENVASWEGETMDGTRAEYILNRNTLHLIFHREKDKYDIEKGSVFLCVLMRRQL